MAPKTLTRRELVGLGAASLLLSARASIAAESAPPLLLRAERSTAGAVTVNGRSPGPAIPAKPGESLAVRFENRLDRPATLHWHGLRVDNAMDGSAGLTQSAVEPGQSFDYRFTPTEAGTFWYHADTGADGEALTAAGLFGAVVVGDDAHLAVDRDMTLVIHDEWPASDNPSILVNGERVATMALKSRERLRLRLVNARDGRLASLAFGGFEPSIVALDGRPVNEAFAPEGHRLDLAPGGRADLVVDAAWAADQPAGMAILAESGIAEIARLTRDAGEARAEPLPAPAAAEPVGLPDEIALGEALMADLPLGGELPPSDRPLFRISAGKPVVLAISNTGPADQVVHLHGHAVRLLHPLDDGWEPYWLDTVIAPASQTARLAFVAGLPGRWRVESRALGAPRSTLTFFEVL